MATELEKIVKATGICHALEYGECIPDEVLEAFAHAIVDWVAHRHFEECKEVRLVQDWIRLSKRYLKMELTS
jgi:hypothetical protein